MADARPTAARPTARPLFDPGAIVATPGALQLLAQAGIEPLDLLRRHLAGDWATWTPRTAGRTRTHSGTACGC